jgi:hypothetical protein
MDEKNKIKQINIRLTDSEFELLQKKCKQCGICTSDLIREAIKFYKPAVSLILDDNKKTEAIEDVIRLELQQCVKQIVNDAFQTQLETTFMKLFNDIRKNSDFSFSGNNSQVKSTDQDEIIFLLGEKPKTIAEIIELFPNQKSGAEIYQLLKKMEKENSIQKMDDKYKVTLK